MLSPTNNPNNNNQLILVNQLIHYLNFPQLYQVINALWITESYTLGVGEVISNMSSFSVCGRQKKKKV